jgi:hypothetical protein
VFAGEGAPACEGIITSSDRGCGDFGNIGITFREALEILDPGESCDDGDEPDVKAEEGEVEGG